MQDNKLPEQVIIDILAKEMSLDTSEQIWIRNQTRLVPSEKGLYVVVGEVDAQPFGVTNETRLVQIPAQGDVDGYEAPAEVQTVCMLSNIQIDLFSRDNSAVLRRWEVIAALRSIFSQQQQESYLFKIFRIPRSFLNTSSAEGAANLNRFSIVVSCHVWYQKEKVLSLTSGDYYDDFTQRVDDEETIGEPQGLIEFEIDKTGVK